MKKLWLAIKVLRKGEELQYASTWKTVGAATAVLTVVLPEALNLICLTTGFCPVLTEMQLDGTASAIANIGVGSFILYTIFGTSKKVGL